MTSDVSYCLQLGAVGSVTNLQAIVCILKQFLCRSGLVGRLSWPPHRFARETNLKILLMSGPCIIYCIKCLLVCQIPPFRDFLPYLPLFIFKERKMLLRESRQPSAKRGFARGWRDSSYGGGGRYGWWDFNQGKVDGLSKTEWCEKGNWNFEQWP